MSDPKESFFPPIFHRESWERRDQEEQGLEKAWRGSKKWRSRDRLDSLPFFNFKHDLFYLSIFYSFLHDEWVVYFVSRVCRSNLRLCNGSCMNLWFELIIWVSLIVYDCFYLDWDCLIDSWLSTNQLSMASLFVIWPWWNLQLKLSTWGRSLINVNRKMRFLELKGSGYL